MQATVKKITLSAALLCAIVPACATIALQAASAQAASAAVATAATTTGATAAPSATATASTGRQGTPSPQSASGPREGTALATWFGPGLFGNQTACGQVLTRRLVGLANRTLPCGTLVKVSFRGRALTLPVVDRGPYGPLHARFDLTQAAARMLHMNETSRVAAAIVGHVRSSPRLGLPTAPDAGVRKTTQQAAASAGGAAAS
jgi:rare lipoprotein A (peptidoglycan hydrolase)